MDDFYLKEMAHLAHLLEVMYCLQVVVMLPNQLSVQTDVSAGLLHNVVINGNLTQSGGTIDLFSNNTGGSNATLLFGGTNNSTFISSGGTTPDLYRLVVNKGTSQSTLLNVSSNFTLGAPSDLAVKPLLCKMDC